MYLGLPSYLTSLQPAHKGAGLLSYRFGANRVFRLSASSFAAQADGTAIAIVNLSADASANQVTSANRPLRKALSGKDAIRFTAANSNFLISDLTGLDIGAGWNVVALVDLRADGRLLSVSDSATTEGGVNSLFFQPAGNGLAVGDASHASTYFSTFTDYTAGTTGMALFSARWSGVELKNWLNCVARSGTVAGGTTKLSDGSMRGVSGAPSGTMSQPLQIARRVTSGSALYPDADVYDMVIVSGSLSDEEIQFIEGVIAWGSGAQSLLSASHPWKPAAPSISDVVKNMWGGPIVARSGQANTKWLGSPSMLQTSSGALYVMHDFFAGGSGTDKGGEIYESLDDGVTWKSVCVLSDIFWSKLWQHTDGAFYILSTTREYGDLQIGKSTDKARSWSWTTLSASGGPLAPAGAGVTAPNYSKAPCHPLYYDGYIFFACENLTGGDASGYCSFLLYAPETSDLTDKANWRATAQMPIGAHSYSAGTGFWESTCVADDAGKMWMISRLTGSTTPYNKAVFTPVSWVGTTASLPAWSASLVRDFPGGHTKFDIVKHGGFFYAIVNADDHNNLPRNKVVMTRVSSANLSSATFALYKTLIDDTTVRAFTGMNDADSRAYHGFQYASFDIDGDDVVRVGYRVGWSGAHTFHDSNIVGFARFPL